MFARAHGSSNRGAGRPGGRPGDRAAGRRGELRRLALLPNRHAAAAGSPIGRPRRRGLLDGVRFAWRDPCLRAMTAFSSLGNLARTGVDALLVVSAAAIGPEPGAGAGVSSAV
jgi:hypothetical protein